VEGGVLDAVAQVVLVPEPGREVPRVGDLGRVIWGEGELSLDGTREPGPGLVDGAVEDLVLDRRYRSRVSGAGVHVVEDVDDPMLVVGEGERAIPPGDRRGRAERQPGQADECG